MLELLRCFTQAQPVTASFVAGHCGWEVGVASKALSNAKMLGYVVANRNDRHLGEMTYTLTPDGRARLQSGAETAPPDLAESAIALIVASESGLDSEQLAEKLACSNEQVMQALDQAADDHRVVACRLVRSGVEMRSYRKSAGAPLVTAWGKLTAANAPASEIAAARARSEVATGVDIDAAHRVPSTGRIAKITPLAELIVTLSEEEAALTDDGTEQWFFLYSSGELCMQRADGTQVSLYPDETRALFAWLDRLGGTNLQRLAAAEESPA